MIEAHYALRDVPKHYPVFTERFLRRIVHERRIQYVKIGTRIYFAESDLDAFVADGRVIPN